MTRQVILGSVSGKLSIAEAKAGFAEAVRRAESGESLILTRHGRPVARLVPVDSPVEGTDPRDGGEVRESAEPYARSGSSEPGAKSRPGPSAEPRAELMTSAIRRETLERLLRDRVWPRVPSEQLGAGVSKRERERILGTGSRGV